MSNQYANWSQSALVKRIAQYVGYVGCGCLDARLDEACLRERTCAREDFRRMVQTLKGRLPKKANGKP